MYDRFIFFNRLFNSRSHYPNISQLESTTKRARLANSQNQVQPLNHTLFTLLNNRTK